jgi:hypothetical protein
MLLNKIVTYVYIHSTVKGFRITILELQLELQLVAAGAVVTFTSCFFYHLYLQTLY